MRNRIFRILMPPFMLLAVAASAQTPAGSFASVCDELREGRQIRVLSRDGTRLEAPFAGCRDEALLVMQTGGLRTLPLSEVVAVWSRTRHTGRGARTGALIGTVGGAGFFFVVAQIVKSLGEGETGPGINTLGFTVIGAVMGAAAGAASGAIVGAAMPGWRLAWADDDVASGHRPPVAALPGIDHGRIGSLSLLFGLARAEGAEPDPAGLGMSLALTADYPSGLSLGPEIGIDHAGPQPTAQAFATDRVWHLGVIARYSLQVGAARPYAVAGLAGYSWEDTFVGASLGAGVAVPLRGPRLAARAEYRRHDNFQNLVDSDPGFGVWAAGVHFGW